jgi:hypothetical protein
MKPGKNVLCFAPSERKEGQEGAGPALCLLSKTARALAIPPKQSMQSHLSIFHLHTTRNIAQIITRVPNIIAWFE